MFTGIVQDIGRVTQIKHSGSNVDIVIGSSKLVSEVKLGDSIAINGVCLTATAIDIRSKQFSVTAVTETLRRTTLGDQAVGNRVNLELALRPSDRLGGHFVQGHVDTTGRCLGVVKGRGGWIVRFDYPPEYGRYIIDKGSIAIDGVSLTVYDVKQTEFTVSIIPHTLESTTLQDLQRGQRVNLEFDLIAKYVAKSAGDVTESITIEKLREYGY